MKLLDSQLFNQEAGTVVEVITVHIDPNKGDESNNKIADLFEKSNVNTEYWNRLSQAPQEWHMLSQRNDKSTIRILPLSLILFSQKLDMERFMQTKSWTWIFIQLKEEIEQRTEAREIVW